LSLLYYYTIPIRSIYKEWKSDFVVGNDFHDFIDAATDENVIAVAFFHEAFFFPCIDEGEEGIVEAVDVRNDDGRTFLLILWP